MAGQLEFGDFSIDTDAFELRRGGVPVPVEPLVLDLIIELARRPGLLRTRDDLIETVWKGRIVSDTTISTAIKSARKALLDTDPEKRLIRTVRGRGFQFIADVAPQALAVERQSNSVELPLLAIHVVALDDLVSVTAVRTLEGRLRTILNRIPFLNILAPIGETARPAPGTEGAAGTHRIEIALSSIDDMTHADVTLSDLKLGHQKWARHFVKAQSAGVETLLVDIASKAEPQILKEAAAYLGDMNEDEPKALVLRAMQTIAERGWNPSAIIDAIGLLERATAKDRTLSVAFAIMALLNAIGYRVGMLRSDDSAVKRAIENAEMALSLESQNSVVLGLTGCAFCDVGQLARGEPIINRALDLDPMNGHAHAAKGAALMMKGEFESAVTSLRTSISISPADSRLAVWGAILALAELKCDQLEDARASAEQAMSRDDVNYLPRLAAAAVHLARRDDRAFQNAVKELLRGHPKITANEVSFFVGQRAGEAIWPSIEEARA